MKIINYYRLRHLVQDSDFRFEGHRHGKSEANILLEGKIELTCGDNVYNVESGQFAIWRSGVFHTSRVISPSGARLLSLEFDLDSDTFPSGDSAVYTLNEDDLSLARLIMTSDGEALTRLTEAFFIRLSEREGNTESSSVGLSEVYKSAVNFMAENLSRDINVPELAKHCGVCLTTLKKAFSEYADKGVRAYYIDMKLHYAKQMLASGRSVSEVSDSLGFSSPAYFSQCFKQKVGVPPQKYKKGDVKKVQTAKNKKA
ncbi:MAG: AraC family transcriptional regulator [Clostridia bacterium]|nr:AraC family transcriptional regulator [Clostridia bacterium]